MKIMYWMKVILMGSVLVALASCSSTGAKKANGYQSASVADADAQVAAQAYGLGEDSGFQGDELASSSERDKCANRLKAPANQTYCFEFDSNAVSKQYMEALRIQANYLVANPEMKVRLEGNTDNRGSREYNIGLGWRRDQAVARILEQLGVTPSQIEMLSYGKEHPVVFGDNEESWRINRRVNLIYKQS